MSKATNDALSALHGALATALADKIKEGTATAADLSVAKAFLKDNGITATPVPGSPLANLLDTAPDAPFDEDAELDKQRAIFSGAPSGHH